MRRDTGEAWTRYVEHGFVLALGAGTLPKPAFQHFLRQDYLFLIQFARAYALAGYKSADLRDLRAASASVAAIVDVEMPLHVAYCREWGLTEDDMAAEPEALETVAYTRFVLERGMSGDRLDLEVALVPCVVGYAEAVDRLLRNPRTVTHGNPYAAWMETYAGADYRALAVAAIGNLDRLGATRGAEARYADLLATFTAATRLEASFWDMGLAAA
ncbi:TenA family protein [Limobrevibacterium gyesilva]|uniref:TenA family protein n=1 Tax=Limobrevibacterium gyesilva TaxID=2991712 RepID=A0AA41YLB6_9PROT|nr:TenA family protein [Limobrevibacterium gyesilva]MCW3475539.1 TenA family protein [Limobrevibacterium gyesilva]